MRLGIPWEEIPAISARNTRCVVPGIVLLCRSELENVHSVPEDLTAVLSFDRNEIWMHGGKKIAIQNDDQQRRTFVPGDKRPGYAEIQAASALHPESGAWAFFMREVIRLPREMTPAVCQIIRLGRWKLAPEPLEAVRSDAIHSYRRSWAKPEI